MNEILSNHEIDTLLDMFRSEGIEDALNGRRGGGSGVVDLLKPNRVDREQMRMLDRLMQSAAKALTSTISERLRLDVACDCVGVEQLRFQAWIEQLAGPTAIYVLDAQPLTKPVLLAANTSLLYGAVDRILGGVGRVEQVPADFTEAEYTVADAFVMPCLERLRESLRESLELQWKVQARFCSVAQAQIIPPQDVVVAVHFQVSGEPLLGDLRLVLPFSALEVHLRARRGAGDDRPAPGAMRDTILQSLRPSPLHMSVALGQTTLPLAELLRLQPGDVVPLGTRLGEPLTAPVQGRVKFRGQVGRVGPRLAFRVGEVVAET